MVIIFDWTYDCMFKKVLQFHEKHNNVFWMFELLWESINQDIVQTLMMSFMWQWYKLLVLQTYPNKALWRSVHLWFISISTDLSSTSMYRVLWWAMYRNKSPLELLTVGSFSDISVTRVMLLVMNLLAGCFSTTSLGDMFSHSMFCLVGASRSYKLSLQKAWKIESLLLSLEPV